MTPSDPPAAAPAARPAGQAGGAGPAPAAIGWRRLWAWSALEQRRRRQAQRGAARWPAWSVSAGAGAALAAAVVRGVGGFGDELAGEATVASTSRLWLTAVLVAHALVMFGAPFRLYWRRDSAYLARLAIPGRALFRLALARSLSATAYVAAPSAIAALAFGPWTTWSLAVRHLALVGVAAAGAGLLLPAVALAAGAVVASDKARAALAHLGGGEFQAPRTSWLGVLPGLAASAVVLVVIAGSRWALAGEATAIGDPVLVLGTATALCLLAAGVALAWSDRVMLVALREVSALDQERLAHVDLTRASALERLWASATLRSPAARRLFDKDARLLHRRFPIPYFVASALVVALWIVAAVEPAAMLPWSAALSAALAAYGLVMARRRTIPPTEQPRLLATLPLHPREVAAAKRSQGLLWVVAFQLVGGLPVVARADDVAVAAALLGAIAAASVLAASVVRS